MTPRLPIGPLLVAAGTCTYSDLARQTGRHLRSVQRWRANGLSVTAADELATAIGCHPVTVWGEDWDRVLSGVRFR